MIKVKDIYGEVTTIKQRVNCIKCSNCIEEGKTFLCKFKQMNMGYKPYYRDEIATIAVKDYSKWIRLCDFKPRKKTLMDLIADE